MTKIYRWCAIKTEKFTQELMELALDAAHSDLSERKIAETLGMHTVATLCANSQGKVPVNDALAFLEQHGDVLDGMSEEVFRPMAEAALRCLDAS